MKIELWSDYACPFCYIGEKRLEKALAEIDGGDKVEIEFKSFELDPIKLDDVSYLPDGSRIALERNPVFSLSMHYVPGHTTDSVFYYSAKDNVAFVGDSIFKNSFGLTHFPGGDEQTLMQSITQRILKLPQETVLLSGHTEPTTVGAERERSWYAPFLN